MNNDRQSLGVAVVATYVSNAFQERRMGNMAAYRQLIQRLRTEEDPVMLTGLLTALTQCISSISSHAHELVDAVLSLPWTRHCNDEALVTAHLDFYESLLSAHASFAVPCIRTATMQLSFAPGSPVREALGDDASDAAIAAAFAHVHDFLATVLRVVPTSVHALLPNLTDAFPHKRLDTPSHVWYLRNLLLVLGYAPALLADIIALIVDRIIQVDVEIQVDLEDISALQASDFDGPQFDEDRIDEDDGDYAAVSPMAAQAQLRRLIDKLDNMMLIMFEFLQQRCLENPSVNANSVLLAILPTFERIVMQTSRSRHLQFLYFYFVCAASPPLDEQFLSFLMHVLIDPQKSLIVRQSAAAYIASFVARARSVSVATARSCLDLLVKWLHSFLDYFESSGRDDDDLLHGHEPQRHALFYYVCQSVFYIVCFRHAQLFARTADVDGAAAMHRLGLDRVVNSRLNPLRVCLPTVVNEFARVMHAHQIVYCYAALQRNGGRNGGGGGGGANALSADAAVRFESFFAFEPFHLKRSVRFVEPHYQRWEDREGADDWEGGGVAAAAAVGGGGGGGGQEEHIVSPAVQIAGGRARRRAAPDEEEEEDDDELADLVLSPESVEMDFMFQMRSPSARAGAAFMAAQHARRRSGRR